MCKKTVLRRLCKHIETDFESVEARGAWEDGSGMDFAKPIAPVSNKEEVVDVFADEEPTEEPQEEVVDEAVFEQIEFPEGLK